MSPEPTSSVYRQAAVASDGPRGAPPPAGARDRRRAARFRPGRRSAGLLLATAAVVYNDWLLEFWLPTGLDPRHSYVSELFAADQPFRVTFAIVELLAAVLVAGGALLARSAADDPWSRAGCRCLAAFGAASVADVVVPMRCAPSVEAGCEAVNPWHTTTSALVHAALFISMALFAVAARDGRSRWSALRRWIPWVPAGALVAAVSTVGPLFGHPGWHGVPQRAHLVLAGMWFALLATALLRAAPGGRGEAQTSSSGTAAGTSHS
ncbi:DUF998 domain-containing protein [Streptomyces orinoci]|uniref:DUF998 domain-containing protein n=1 Tax=Streptomyces orinoci TaxID=67339 RepID=A0ABV3JSR0_STRON|nr:DUF998 domain-containing protein [Streptomyces orinoci]